MAGPVCSPASRAPTSSATRRRRTDITCRRSRKPPTQQRLEEAQTADILHITCHGGLRKQKPLQPGTALETPAKGAPFWTLNLATAGVEWLQILPSTVSRLSRTSRPLVFGNACQSTGSAGINASPGNLISSFGPMFYARGAIAFIGTVAPINRVVALRFASKFYDKLLNAANGNCGADQVRGRPRRAAPSLGRPVAAGCRDGLRDPADMEGKAVVLVITSQPSMRHPERRTWRKLEP